MTDSEWTFDEATLAAWGDRFHELYNDLVAADAVMDEHDPREDAAMVGEACLGVARDILVGIFEDVALAPAESESEGTPDVAV